MTTSDGSYNSAALVHGGHIDAPYHKMHLLTFGEQVPFASAFPALRRAFVRGTVAELTHAGFPLVPSRLEISGDVPLVTYGIHTFNKRIVNYKDDAAAS